MTPQYLLAILNSTLMNFYHRYKFLDLEKNLFQKILIANCKMFPIKEIDYKQQKMFSDNLGFGRKRKGKQK